MSDETHEQPLGEPSDAEGEQVASVAELILIQVSDDIALAFGSGGDEVDIQPMIGLTDTDRAAIRDAAAMTIGGLNVLASLAPALESAAGLVRLTAATRAALTTFTPLVTANGANAGTLVDGAGKFAHSVQWIPTAAGGLSIAAALGPSAASLAIQMQLREISKKLDTNIALTRDVLNELQWKARRSSMLLYPSSSGHGSRPRTWGG